MLGRHAMSWWHRNLDRAAQFCSDFVDVSRHEGPLTASRVLGAKLLRFARYRLLGSGVARLEHQHDPGPSAHLGEAERAALPLKPGVLFVGYVEASLGLGESLRGLINSTAQTPTPFAIYPFNVNVESRVTGPFREAEYDTSNPHAINVIETATDQLPAVFKTLGDWRTQRSYNILRTYWELPVAPQEWAPLLTQIHEIWAPNAFVADALRPIFDGPISIIPPCVEIDEEPAFDRAHFGLQPDVFYFLFSFDYFSYPARKNPVGVIRAFQAAFPGLDENVGLVIKSTGSQDNFPEIKAVIAAAARRDPRILVIDGTLTRPEIVSLFACSDSYVSLHRSEGFGLGMVETMAYGKPVIGTDFSGSTDFLSQQTGFPVPCEIRPVRRGEYIYFEGQVWAEPDIEAAADAMRAVLAGNTDVVARAAAGQAFVRERYGRDSVGAKVATRIGEIMAQNDLKARG
jgi:glycosyltransferase involved in cell wall biosynthesis